MIHNDRKIHSALMKLRTKHNGLKHNASCRFHTIDEEGNEADPWCRFGCPKREDEDHLLLDCPQFESHRNKLKSHLADLKVSFSSKILLGLEKNIPEEKETTKNPWGPCHFPSKNEYLLLSLAPSHIQENSTNKMD